MRSPLPTTCFAALLAFCGCGYVGEPLPPALNMPKKITDLRAAERGENIVVEFTIPDRTTEELPLKRLGEVELRLGPADGAQFDFNRWYQSAERIQAVVAGPGPVEVAIPARKWAGREVILSVRVSSAKGRFSDWATPVALMVVDPVATAENLRAENHPAGVKLSWQAAPRQAVSFRIYRRAGAEKEARLIAASPAPEWIDTGTVYGTRYAYSVQAVARAGEAEAESGRTPEVEIVPADVFPPATPAGLTAAPTPESIELVWERNTEPDFAVYRLYRSANGGAFERIADALLAPNYSDRRVTAGARYRYQVAAVDLQGNESQPSQPVEVIAK